MIHTHLGMECINVEKVLEHGHSQVLECTHVSLHVGAIHTERVHRCFVRIVSHSVLPS